MGWRESLETLQKQFEAQAARSRGLHHLMVEVADDERDRMAGPEWFVRERKLGSAAADAFRRAEPWFIVQSSGLPGIHPRYSEVRMNESLDGIRDDRIVRDGSGNPRAIFEPMRLRHSYLCGDSNALKGFQSLAEATSRTLVGVSELEESELAGDVADLFRNPHGGIRYVFGSVIDPPRVFVARGWQAGSLVYPEGVLIDLPIAESTPSDQHWLLLLHRLAWRRIPGSPLQGERLAWHQNTTVPYEWIVEREFDAGFPEQWKERFAQIPTTSYYSILGTQEHPMDVHLASAFAIGLLLSAKAKSAGGTKLSSIKADYSKEVWYGLPMPSLIVPASKAAELKRQWKPKVVLLTATPTERDTVLKHLQPLPDTAGVIRLFHQNNAFFLGCLGNQAIVLCMCSMGASGRDSAQIVTAEVLRFWKPAALTMVGIAFGRDSERQKIGDVLISERIIAYEPERVGSKSTISRGQEFLAVL